MIENIQGVIENYPVICGVGLGVLLLILLAMHVIIKQLKFMIKFGIFIFLVIGTMLVLAYLYETNGSTLPFLN
ncbi:MAG: hypothetical protein COA79_15335 [Planctomycetota bacterium]|nr:MAG: hypothetical protein COA79_15335 [Planctomycetota bacterium]